METVQLFIQHFYGYIFDETTATKAMKEYVDKYPKDVDVLNGGKNYVEIVYIPKSKEYWIGIHVPLGSHLELNDMEVLRLRTPKVLSLTQEQQSEMDEELQRFDVLHVKSQPPVSQLYAVLNHEYY
jgi:hypothetical protein